MDRYCKRLIEVDLPIKRISAHSRREKNIRGNHISTLHIWWARRPLAACRAVICASLWPDPADELCPESFREAARSEILKWATVHLRLVSEESYPHFIAIQKKPERLHDNKLLKEILFDFIADFSNWDNSTIPEFLQTCRHLTQIAHESLGGHIGTKPLVVDPFAGGGAIPLEALRVGADAFASDLNPIAVLINILLQKYLPARAGNIGREFISEAKAVRERVWSRVGKYFSEGPSMPMAYIWARTIRCEGPACGMEIPLLTSPILCKRKGKHAWIEFTGDSIDNKLSYTVKTSINPPKSVLPGTSKMGSATCPSCGYTMNKKSV